MALNFTPLKAYVSENGRNVESQKAAGRAIAGIAEGLANIIKDKKYERKSRDFFNSLGDGEIQQIDAQIAEIDARINELEQQLNDEGEAA